MDKFTKQINTVSMNIEPMSLKFFAYRFMINEEYLQYGIVKKTNRKTGEKEYIPAVLIKGRTNRLVNKGWLTVFINVCKDCLASNISDSQYGHELFPAEFSEDDEDFCFRYKKCEIRLNKNMMKEFYSNRVFGKSVGLLTGAVPEMFEEC
ncbi:MAG: hypothetical protein LBC68_01450 [Prevotellaceae bacterium]|nr:hypothetical protein [Prevotellaceae bacterium]